MTSLLIRCRILRYGIPRRILEGGTIMSKIIASSVMIIMILSSAAAFAEDTHKADEIIFDIIAVRPVGFVTLTISTVFFIVSLPYGVMSGSTYKAAKTLVADPFNYVFTRPLGDFNNASPHLDGQNKKDKDSVE
jgi:hypothetical protein